MRHKVWEFAEVDEAQCQRLAETLGVSQALAAVLVRRGLDDAAEARAFLDAKAQPFHDPFLLRDMELAVARISDALASGEKITVYGDYDVDGISSTALLVRALRRLGASVSYYIPERQSEGYGLSCDALERIAADGTRLVITVDCGISAVEEAAFAVGKVDLIVTDHHSPQGALPRAAAVVNPKRPDCAYPDKRLAGVGVAYKLCQALWQRLRGEAFEGGLDLAALGTVADVVPLLGENRLIVSRGLAAMEKSAVVGLAALVRQCGMAGGRLSAGRIGFGLAPRLNAAGRLDSAARGVELLLTEDAAEAAEIAAALDEGNRQRQEIEQEILVKAQEQIARDGLAEDKVLVVAGEGWHSGVIGIVASRLVEAYYKPTVVIGVKDGVGKGSCRSIPGFDMHAALCEAADCLEQFGGHAQAAGFSVLPENIPLLRGRLCEIAARELTAADFVPRLPVESAVALSEIDEAFVEQLARLEPYGMGNPRPVFSLSGAQVRDARTMGKEGAHLRFKASAGGVTVDALAWQAGDAAAELEAPDRVDIAFQPEINEWQGRRSVQLLMQDFRPAEPSAVERLFEQPLSCGAYETIGAADSFYTKIVGVTFEGRQEAVARLTAGEALVLRREPQNPHDANAIAFLARGGEMLGYLRAPIAREIAPLVDAGAAYEARVSEVTGAEKDARGVNVFVWRKARAAASPPAARQSLREEDVRRAILGDRAYHDAQKEALALLAAGKSALVVMGTGRGKSAIFQTHAALMARGGSMSVVLYPLRALVNDQYAQLRQKLAPLGLSVYKGNGTLSPEERGALFAAMEAGAVDVLLTTPEFLAANLGLFSKGARTVGFFVVDECHHVAEDGHRPAYANIGKLAERLGAPVSLAVTATATARAAECVERAFGIEARVVDPTVRVNLRLEDARGCRDKLAYLQRLTRGGEKTLVFVNSRAKAVELAAALREGTPSLAERVGFYHAGLSNTWRETVEDWFRSGALSVLVATSAFGEGVDLPDIRHVVEYHMPLDATTFNQQCGRAGRDGESAAAHLLFGADDARLNRRILEERAPQRETLGKLYLLLKALHGEGAPIALTNAELAARYGEKCRGRIGEAGVGSCLKILEELGFLLRETRGSRREIHFYPAAGVKLDLLQSTAFAEGLREREAFEVFARTVLEESGEALLARINRPICP